MSGHTTIGILKCVLNIVNIIADDLLKTGSRLQDDYIDTTTKWPTLMGTDHTASR